MLANATGNSCESPQPATDPMRVVGILVPQSHFVDKQTIRVVVFLSHLIFMISTTLTIKPPCPPHRSLVLPFERWRLGRANAEELGGVFVEALEDSRRWKEETHPTSFRTLGQLRKPKRLWNMGQPFHRDPPISATPSCPPRGISLYFAGISQNR